MSDLRVHRVFSETLPTAKCFSIPPDTERETDARRNMKPENGDQRKNGKDPEINELTKDGDFDGQLEYEYEYDNNDALN